ncbi:Las1-domain-containing protein [Pyrenochaeta sp. DS3sAY3a]|nr:Las1-domain-containing protein [Pyrenochaeta sp. DS3sAY3a]
MEPEPSSRPQFVVTPWRNPQDLLQVRQDLYSRDALRRERAVNKVLAWRLRKPNGLPLLLDATVDIVDVVLQDERGGLKHNALRLLYATAISRFITGLLDTQLELSRDRPSWFPPGKSLQLPYPLLEVRHRIVHRHLPSLAELIVAATQSLDWLWEWYWGHLDDAFGLRKATSENGEQGMEMETEIGTESQEAVREKIQSILKVYIKDRKAEIKARKKTSSAADTALSTYTLRYSTPHTSPPSHTPHETLLHLLIASTMILPADKKPGSPMSGALLIWTPFLLAFTSSYPPLIPISMLLAQLFRCMAGAPFAAASEADAVKEGMYEWLVHVLLSDAWKSARQNWRGDLVQSVLEKCLVEPGVWSLKLARAIVDRGEGVGDREAWRAVLDAAGDEEMDMDDGNKDGGGSEDVEMIETAKPVTLETEKTKEKTQGPQKVLGLWRPRPIGWLPEGVEDDE